MHMGPCDWRVADAGNGTRCSSLRHGLAEHAQSSSRVDTDELRAHVLSRRAGSQPERQTPPGHSRLFWQWALSAVPPQRSSNLVCLATADRRNAEAVQQGEKDSKKNKRLVVGCTAAQCCTTCVVGRASGGAKGCRCILQAEGRWAAWVNDW